MFYNLGAKTFALYPCNTIFLSSDCLSLYHELYEIMTKERGGVFGPCFAILYN